METIIKVNKIILPFHAYSPLEYIWTLPSLSCTQRQCYNNPLITLYCTWYTPYISMKKPNVHHQRESVPLLWLFTIKSWGLHHLQPWRMESAQCQFTHAINKNKQQRHFGWTCIIPDEFKRNSHIFIANATCFELKTHFQAEQLLHIECLLLYL